MDYRYAYLDPRLVELEQLLARLKGLFEHLLLQSNGDVDQALRWLEEIDRRHNIFGDRLDIDRFKHWLEDSG